MHCYSATDHTKAKIVLNTMVTMFSEYCENKFEVEPVELVSHDGSKSIYPDLSCYKMVVSLSDIVGPIGISLDETQETRRLDLAIRGMLGIVICSPLWNNLVDEYSLLFYKGCCYSLWVQQCAKIKAKVYGNRRNVGAKIKAKVYDNRRNVGYMP